MVFSSWVVSSSLQNSPLILGMGVCIFAVLLNEMDLAFFSCDNMNAFYFRKVFTICGVTEVVDVLSASGDGEHGMEADSAPFTPVGCFPPNVTSIRK
jgi:hypothetical protein